MLPKENRIRKDVNFRIICRQGRTFSNNGLVLKIKENRERFSRVGVSVGIKFSPKAVERNRIKRQIRAFFCQNLTKISPGWDMVVIMGKGWSKGNNPSEDIRRILVKNRLFKE
jgi:ribonuclease P protein component